MTYVSIYFYIFLFFSVFIYYVVPIRYRWIELLIASIVFYVFCGIWMIPVVLVISWIAWFAAVRIDKIYTISSGENITDKEQKKLASQRIKSKCRLILSVSVIILISFLSVAKLSRYMPQNMSAYIIVPIGISYFTFSIISYLADVYWKRQKAESNYFKFTLYVLYFPKILQGPISRYKNLGHQLIEGHRFDYQRVCFGLQLMIWGIFKKLVIADRLAIFVNSVYGDISNCPGSVILVATFFATFQLYADFSGCMDIASGISKIYGIELEKNFDHPFFSRSAAEFWRRWHITLGTFFKDYVYMPIVSSPGMAKLLQKLRKKHSTEYGKMVMTTIPLAVVWLLTGIWHGTGLAYVVWGLYWGVIIICSNILQKKIVKLNQSLHIRTDANSWKVFQMFRTFLIFMFGRIITIPNNLQTTGLIIQKIFTDMEPWHLFDQSIYGYGLNRPNFLLAIYTIILLWIVSILQSKYHIREKIAEFNIVFRWMIYYAAVFCIIIFGIWGMGYEASSFVYMQF